MHRDETDPNLNRFEGRKNDEIASENSEEIGCGFVRKREEIRRVSLTQIWQHVVKFNRLPDRFTVRDFFDLINRKLLNPEWEIRQYSLRVLSEIIPIFNTKELDLNIEETLNEIIRNLGHINIAVKKSAIDALRIYIDHANNPNLILKELIQKGVERSNKNKVNPNIILGIIISIPFLINPKISTELIKYAIKILSDKLDNYLFQEYVIKSLLKLKEIVGRNKFETYLEPKVKEKFEMLCELYNFPDLNQEIYENKPFWSDFNQNLIQHKTDTNFEPDKVILETEIKLEKGPAITMKIHEENHFFDSDESDRENNPKFSKTFRVLDDSDEDFDSFRKTPRRVRFGGEIVKMRTPDSDNNNQNSDENERDFRSKKSLEVNYKKSNVSNKSRIPIRIGKRHRIGFSEPNSPKRIETKRLYQSSPNLSRIPKKKKIDSKKIKKKTDENPIPALEYKPSSFSVHKQIEVFHNLTRSPENTKSKNFEDRHLTTADNVLLEKIPNISERKIRTADAVTSTTNQVIFVKNYNSFHIYNANGNGKVEEFEEESIPINNAGDCLTCSSSGSEAVAGEDIAFVDERILHDIQIRNDLPTKKRGLEELLKSLKNPNILASASEKLPFFLEVLFKTQREPLLESISEQILEYIFANMDEAHLRSKTQLIAYNLSKTGSPIGIRLALVLLKKIDTRFFIENLLSDSILGAKSSKIREGALQIFISITRIFPSTDFDVESSLKSILKTLNDKKRKVRQAVLEAVAALTQLSCPNVILEFANRVFENHENKTQLLKVIRTRLSRKTLPTVDSNGNVRYSTPLGIAEFEFLGLNGFPERRSESTGCEKVNYWVTRKGRERGGDFEWDSHEHQNKDDSLNKTVQPQVFGVNPENTYSQENNNQIKGCVRPVFLIHPDSSQSCESLSNLSTRSHKQTNTDSVLSSQENSFENGRSYKKSEDEFDRIPSSRCKFYNRFQKSFSSDHLVPCERERCFGQSWSSSSTSGSSMRSNGSWIKDVRSGIPIPINNDSRFKIRTDRKLNEFKGPVSAVQYYNPKLQSPEAKFTPTSRPIMATQPFSSGSESSGYFTPPAEPLLLPDIFNQKPNKNFTIIDGNSFDTVDFEHPKEFGEKIEIEPQEDDEEKSSNDVEIEEEEIFVIPKKRDSMIGSLENLDFLENCNKFRDGKVLSKSEANILSSTEFNRKSINSAPTVKKTYENFKTLDETPITSLPGSVVDFQEIEVIQKVTEKTQSKNVCTKKITKQLSRKKSIKTVNAISPKPKENLPEILSQLNNPEWEITMKGLLNLTNLINNNKPLIESNLHSICVPLAKHIRNLRSQVARNACKAASELFKTVKKTLIEIEIEELATPLLHRTADTNKFLRNDANSALDEMVNNLSAPKVVSVITSKGSSHQNAIVRCASVRLLCNLCHKLGAEKVFQLPKETRDKILLTGANMLMEGSLETRKHAKMLLGILSRHNHFHKTMMETVPSHTMRHISKSLKNLT